MIKSRSVPPARKIRKRWFLVGFCLLVYLNNSSLFVQPLSKPPLLVAHRGLGQAYDRTGLTRQSCTAEKMIPTEHAFLENTLPGIRAAFEFGATWVEIDVHRTVDDRFAVFHDWTLDCRTNEKGRTRDRTLADLQKLDIGYGYTADGGKTWPFRGKGIGMMPSLEQVLLTFPDQDFLIDIKSGDPTEGEVLARRLKEWMPQRTGRLLVHGGAESAARVVKALPEIKAISRKRIKRGMLRYGLISWTGYVPEDCRNTVLMVPANFAPWLWGWPHRFFKRMDRVGTKVLLMGSGGSGFNDPEQAARLPQPYAGGIWTDRIDLIGPAMTEKETQ